MNSLSYTTLNCNKKIAFDFNGGNLSSDTGLILIKEFIHKIGLDKVISESFHITNKAFRKHSEMENLMQMIYQIIAAYYEDDRADHLRKDSVMTSLLDKDSLASQPTISRFFKSMTEETEKQFNEILKKMRKIVYDIECPLAVILDIDSTLLNTHGDQEGHAWNFHYQDNGYHPQLCYDGITGDLIKIQLRDGNVYSSNGIVDFIEPILKEYKSLYPYINIIVRCDSGYATPELYSVCEKYNVSYAIRLKENSVLRELAQPFLDEMMETCKENTIDYCCTHCSFEYQAGSWDSPRHVSCRIEKPQDMLLPKYTFIVDTMNSASDKFVVDFYCCRGNMENFIKECKNDFDFSAVSSHGRITNANRLQVHGLAYNIINWMRRLVFPKHMLKDRMNTIRLNLIKIASKTVKHGRKIIFHLCSSCPHKNDFYTILDNINRLKPRLW